MKNTAAYKASGDTMFLDTAEQTADYVFREMTGRHGEFYSAEDADSEGEEGKFYVWDYEEVCKVLGREKGEALQILDICFPQVPVFSHGYSFFYIFL